MNMGSVFGIFVGAGCGALVRWALGNAFNPLVPTLPLGTLAANVTGGLLIGVALGVFDHFQALPVVVRLTFTTGFLGGLTTFSTFSAETTLLLLRQQYAWACTIVSAHVAGSLLATLAGIRIARILLPVVAGRSP